jgi:hypothetical protein
MPDMIMVDRSGNAKISMWAIGCPERLCKVMESECKPVVAHGGSPVSFTPTLIGCDKPDPENDGSW